MEQQFSSRHRVCQPSIRQWVLQLFPSIPKSLGRSCEQLLCGCVQCTVLWDCSGQHFPPQAEGTRCSCAFVPSCVGIIAGMVCSMFGLCLCSVCSLWCSHCWPRRVFACIPFFRRYRQNQCSPDSLFRALKCSWISTLPSACDRA